MQEKRDISESVIIYVVAIFRGVAIGLLIIHAALCIRKLILKCKKTKRLETAIDALNKVEVTTWLQVQSQVPSHRATVDDCCICFENYSP
jgi:uncharacterized membrane protein YvbJ